MSEISNAFCDTLGNNSICFSLETSRSCKRYHIDNVPMRLIVTYYGKGTEWLPPFASNYNAYYNGEINRKIVKYTNEKKFMRSWDIAIFKGHKFKGEGDRILHRTPDVAQNKLSLLMRLDDTSSLADNF